MSARIRAIRFPNRRGAAGIRWSAFGLFVGNVRPFHTIDFLQATTGLHLNLRVRMRERNLNRHLGNERIRPERQQRAQCLPRKSTQCRARSLRQQSFCPHFSAIHPRPGFMFLSVNLSVYQRFGFGDGQAVPAGQSGPL